MLGNIMVRVSSLTFGVNGYKYNMNGELVILLPFLEEAIGEVFTYEVTGNRYVGSKMSGALQSYSHPLQGKDVL